MAAYWYYLQNGNQGGPTDQATLQRMLGNGQLNWGDLVWNETMPVWAAADQVPELAASRGVATPAAVPPPFQPDYSAATVQAAPVSAGSALPRMEPVRQATPAPSMPSWGSGPAAFAAPVAPFASPASNTAPDVSGTTVQLLTKTRTWVRLLGILTYLAAALALLGGLLALVTTVRMGTGIGVASVALLAYFLVAALVAGFGALLNRYASRITVLQTTRQLQALDQALDAQRLLWKVVGILVMIGIAINVLILIVALVTFATTWMSQSF